jgi:uncharacterized protein YciI
MENVDRAKLLGRDYWLVRSTPLPTTTAADIEAHVEAHLRWLLALEADGTVLLSGPLTTGAVPLPAAGPPAGAENPLPAGHGVTVLRAADAEQAAKLAASDPFVVAGLRTAEVFGWRVNEGSIQVRVSLGTGTYTWE